MTLEEETILSVADQLDNVALQVQDLHSDVDQIKEEQQNSQEKVLQFERKIDILSARIDEITERLSKLETNSPRRFSDRITYKESFEEGSKVKVLNPPRGYQGEGTIIGFTPLFIKIRLDQDNKEIRRSKNKVTLLRE